MILLYHCWSYHMSHQTNIKQQKQYFDFIPNLYVEGAYALKFLLPIYYHSSEMRGLGYVTPVQNVLI